MKALGLIVEYNPFHNGHAYHLQASQEKTNADIVICVMSGYFLQRGEPALLPRRERTEMALRGGADLVVELPYIFSSQHASWFAKGAVSILHHLGAGVVCFGSEHGQIDPFLQLADFLDQNEHAYNHHVKQFINEGYSYPKAASLAFRALSPDTSLPDLTQPNNILGYHYIRSIRELKSNMKPETIARHTAGYHETQISQASIASATSIRRSLINHQQTPEDIKHTIPSTTKHIMQAYESSGNDYFHWEQYFPLLQAKVLTLPVSFLAQIYEAQEGLEHRFSSHIKLHNNFHAFMEAFKTKRYTWTRLQRFAVQLLTGTTKAEAQTALQPEQADHIRILGMNEKGQSYLNHIKKQMEIPVYTKMPREKTPQQTLDERACLAYYSRLTPKERTAKWKEEYQLPPVRL
ncbi:Predicted nucleotidyltransferase [Alteribacillus persepolensis]|uniref:tRNA(Met) cytidine acetate ligase n=1 Tax=Alteribacillus persepolensis TaxID=568899 RepID=A0A1G7YE55_9BACI|nr:nucleotidyltransferase [Alteribacillus persepolensis]SDG94637.1 Predicted nucleotidyltransferase [Alteribacillus persepolensis]